MRVLLDADGVLVDFLTPLLATIKRVTGLAFQENHLDNWYIFGQVAEEMKVSGSAFCAGCGHWLVDVEDVADAPKWVHGRSAVSCNTPVPAEAAAVEKRVWAAWDHGPELEPYPEARPAVNALRALGADIYVVTAMSPRFAERRLAMLARCFDIPADHVVFTTAKHVVSGDLFVDDHPENVKAWSEENYRGTAVLFARAYNQGQGMTRGGWGMVLDHTRRIQADITAQARMFEDAAFAHRGGP